MSEENTPKPGSSKANRQKISTYEELAACSDGRLISLSEIAKVMGRSTRCISLLVRRLEKKSGSPLLLDIGSEKPRFAVTAGSLKRMLSIAYQVRPGEVEELNKRVTEVAALLDRAVQALNEISAQQEEQANYSAELEERIDGLADIAEILSRSVDALSGNRDRS